MNRSNRQEPPKTVWEALYDFLNEIFAAMIPGAFFLSYFFCVAFIVLKSMQIVNDFAQNLGTLLTIVVISVAYCFGALFQRREIKKVDFNSARYIYRKLPHNSKHSFAFANSLTNDYITRLVRIIQFHAILEILRQEPESDDFLEALGGKGHDNDFINKLAADIQKAIAEMRANIGCCRQIDLAEYRAILSHMFMLYPNRNKHLHYNNQDLENKIRRIHKAFRKHQSPGLKQLIEERAWDLIADEYSKVAGDSCKTSSSYAPLLDHSMLKPFLKRNVEHNEKQNLAFLQTFEKLIKSIKNPPDDKHEFLIRMQAYIHSDLGGTVDWPYTHMYRYCRDRGLPYAEQVNWGDGAVYVSILDEIGLTTDPGISDEINRSKSRINTDKMDIAEKDPPLYRAINKNEAHIRFMNSIWYATETLLKVTIILGVLAFPAYYLLPELSTRSPLVILTANRFFYLEAVSVAYILICFCIKHSVLEILHYQRVRELNMILKAKYNVAGKKTKMIQALRHLKQNRGSR